MNENNEEREKEKITPELDDERRRLLNVRKKQKAKKPWFRQTDSHKKKKLEDKWRRPRGLHNKMRIGIKGKPAVVKAGYGSPACVRGLHPSGFEEVLVSNINQLEHINAKTQAVRIAGNVGYRKRELIENRANELGLRVLNPRVKEE